MRCQPRRIAGFIRRLRRDEVLLLKIADTKTDISARLLYTASTDPLRFYAFPRESIEAAHAGVHPANARPSNLGTTRRRPGPMSRPFPVRDRWVPGSPEPFVYGRNGGSTGNRVILPLALSL